MIPCAKSELMLFDEVPVQSSILSSSWVDYHSLTNPENNGPLEYFVGGTQDEYLDLNDTKLYLQCQMEVTTADAVVAPTNLLLSSLFRDASLSLNDTIVQTSEALYSYKAMINSMLMFDDGTKGTQLQAAGWYADTVGHVNAGTADNLGFSKRAAMAAGRQTFELIGPLHLDMMTQPRYLLPGVDVRVRLTRQEDKFALMCTNKGGSPAKLSIIKAILYVRKVKVLTSVIEGHESGLLKYNAVYPIQHTRGQTFTIPIGVQSCNQENLFQGRMPKLIIIGMVANRAINGAFAENPFNFQHFGVSYCGLFRDGESVPDREPYQIESDTQLLRPYMGMIHAMEMFNRNENNGISLEEYRDGSTLFAFNLAPDLTVGSGCQQAYRSGNLRLELRFRAALASTINVIVYGVFDGKIEITRQRNVITDY